AGRLLLRRQRAVCPAPPRPVQPAPRGRRRNGARGRCADRRHAADLPAGGHLSAAVPWLLAGVAAPGIRTLRRLLLRPLRLCLSDPADHRAGRGNPHLHAALLRPCLRAHAPAPPPFLALHRSSIARAQTAPGVRPHGPGAVPHRARVARHLLRRTLMRSPKLSIVIPAYNEAGRLPASLERIVAYLETRDQDYEVIVVDD